jgi:hypothetical protein
VKPHRIFPHGSLEELAPSVWRVKGGLAFPFTRNMIVLRLESGDLLLHSVVAMNAAGMAALERLGRPAYAIIPSLHHLMDAPFYKRRYPDLMMLAPESLRSAIEQKVKVDATVEDVLPALGIRLHAVPATKAVEYVYEAPMPAGGRMLMVNDALGNVGAGSDNFLGRALFRHIWVPRGEPRLGRLYRWTQARDAGEIQRFLARLATTRDLRLVTVSHGEPIREGAAAKLRALAPA